MLSSPTDGSPTETRLFRSLERLDRQLCRRAFPTGDGVANGVAGRRTLQQVLPATTGAPLLRRSFREILQSRQTPPLQLAAAACRWCSDPRLDDLGLSALLRACAHPDSNVRRGAAWELCVAPGDVRVGEAALALVGDENSDVVIASAHVLAGQFILTGSRPLLNRVLELLQGEPPAGVLFKTQIVWILTPLVDEPGVAEALLQAASSEHLGGAAMDVMSLPQAVREALRRASDATKSGLGGTSRVAETRLEHDGQLPDDTLQRVVEALRRIDGGFYWGDPLRDAIGPFGKSSDEGSIILQNTPPQIASQLKGLTWSSNEGARETAARALAWVPPYPDVERRLTSLATNRSSRVRAAALLALARRGAGDVGLFLNAIADPHVSVRCAALQALATTDVSGTPHGQVCSALADPDSRVRQAAAELLENVPAPWFRGLPESLRHSLAPLQSRHVVHARSDGPLTFTHAEAASLL